MDFVTNDRGKLIQLGDLSSELKKGHKKRQIHRYDLPTLASIKTWGIQRELVICRHKDGGFC